MKCKGRGDYHKQVYDRKPVIQIDYCFLVSKTKYEQEVKDKYYDVRDKIYATVLSGVDVTTGMVGSCVVKAKGSNDYAVNELLVSFLRLDVPKEYYSQTKRMPYEH